MQSVFGQPELQSETKSQKAKNNKPNQKAIFIIHKVQPHNKNLQESRDKPFLFQHQGNSIYSGRGQHCLSLVWTSVLERWPPKTSFPILVVRDRTSLKGSRRQCLPRMLVSNTEAFTSISKSTLSWRTSTTLWNSEVFPKIWNEREPWPHCSPSMDEVDAGVPSLFSQDSVVGSATPSQQPRRNLV